MVAYHNLRSYLMRVYNPAKWTCIPTQKPENTKLGSWGQLTYSALGISGGEAQGGGTELQKPGAPDPLTCSGCPESSKTDKSQLPFLVFTCNTSIKFNRLVKS